MAPKAHVENPISLVKPAQAGSVQAILDRAHRQEQSADKAVTRTADEALRPPRGMGLLSKTLWMALSHHGRTRKNGPSLRPVAPDTNGRAFHFSHSTVGRGSGDAGKGPPAGTKSGAADTGQSAKTGDSNAGANPATKSPTSSSTGRAQPDLGSKEAGHQRYVERDVALARDPAEEFGMVVEPHRQPSVSREHEAAEGIETGRGFHRDKVREAEEEKNAAGRAEERARPIEIDVTAMQKEIGKAARGRRTQSAEAAQAYIEDPTKVAPQVRHGHSNSFGTISQTFEERVSFWNDVQKHEREKDARTQIRLVLELPHEATSAARQEIVKRFCEEYERLGVPYWASIHAPTEKNDDRNHHAHIVHGIRPARMMVDPTTGKRAWDFVITETYRTACRHKKTTHPFRQNVVKEFRDWQYVRDTRKRFAETANQVLEEAGCPIRYDARSYKDMGLDIGPMKHVARILTDKSKIHDFVVMDPEWTRRMIEQEMNAAAAEREKTYVELKRVEKRLAEVSNSITRLKDANAKLPKNMTLSPLSRMTVATAQVITRSMLKIEQETIEQSFADKTTERTIQHVIDATAPTSGHRGGKQRRAKPVDGAEAPDERAMAFLHEAALEEMRLHRISTSGRMRVLGLRAAAKLAEWRSEADPPLRADAPTAETPRRASPAAALHPPPPTTDEPTNGRAANAHQTYGGTFEEPTKGFAPLPTTPLDVVLAMKPNASEQQKQGIMNTMARMQAWTEAVNMATNGPEEFAEAVKAMIAPVMQRREGAPRTANPTTPNQPDARLSTTKPHPEQVERTPQSPAAETVPTARQPTAEPAQAQPTNHRPLAEAVCRQPEQATPRPTTPPAPSRTATAMGAAGRTPLRGTERPIAEQTTPSREPDLSHASNPIGHPPASMGSDTAPAKGTEPEGLSTRAEVRATTSAPASGTEPKTAALSDETPRSTVTEVAPMQPPKDRILGPDDFLPKGPPYRKLQRSEGTPTPNLKESVQSWIVTKAQKSEAQSSHTTLERPPEIVSDVTTKDTSPSKAKRKTRRRIVIMRNQDFSID